LFDEDDIMINFSDSKGNDTKTQVNYDDDDLVDSKEITSLLSATPSAYQAPNVAQSQRNM